MKSPFFAVLMQIAGRTLGAVLLTVAEAVISVADIVEPFSIIIVSGARFVKYFDALKMRNN